MYAIKHQQFFPVSTDHREAIAVSLQQGTF